MLPAPVKKKQSRRSLIPPALKHGAYSTLSLLPGEDEAEYSKLYKQLVADFAPDGPFEHIQVDVIASSTWRQANLGIFHRAKRARKEYGYTPEDLEQREREEEAMDILASQITRREFSDHEIAEILKEEERQNEIALKEQKLDRKAVACINRTSRHLKKDVTKLVEHLDPDEELAKLEETATIEYLEKELKIAERLEGRISRAMKNLMQAKMMKQVLGTSPQPVKQA